MADLLAVIAGQARRMEAQARQHSEILAAMKEITSLQMEAKAQQKSLQIEVKELKTIIADGFRREEPPKRCGPLLTAM